MLFWLGSIEFETPRGRFFLTGTSKIWRSRRRPATKEEAAQVWTFLETRLKTASSNELRPLFELYQELTSEPFNGPSGEPHVSCVLDAVKSALWSKQLHFEIEAPYDPLPELEWEPPPLQNLRPPAQSPSELWRRDQPEAYFKVLLVDETAKALPNQHVTFTHAGHSESEVTDSSSGAAEYASTGAPNATVIIESLDALETELTERWQEFRPPKLIEGAEVTRITLHEADQAIALTHAITHTIQIVPEMGCIYLELLDKSGRIYHTNCPYQIDGPQAFSGTTDENAQLKHDDVFPGTYTLTLTLEQATYTTPVEVLQAGTAAPQLRKLGVVPRSTMATVRGFVYEKSKAFVMPEALPHLREIRELFFSTAPNEVLIVGHTEKTDEPDVNDSLSIDRADIAQAMLLGDTDPWLDMYGTSMPEEQRWGTHEDELMLKALPNYASKPATQKPVEWFQKTRGLTIDNKAGPKTRAKLIEEYMALVGEPLAKDPQYQSTITTHGGGENFPLSDSPEATGSDTATTQDPGTSQDTDTSQQTDTSADTEAATDQAVNRRVEFFFFDSEYGINPPVPGKNSQAGSTEHPTWKDAVVQKLERNVPAVGQPSGTDFVVTVVDELKQPIVGVGLLFEHGSTSAPVTTDANGVARYEAPGVTSVTVTFESPDKLATIMKPIWTPSKKEERKNWVPEDDKTTIVTLYGGNVVSAA